MLVHVIKKIVSESWCVNLWLRMYNTCFQNNEKITDYSWLPLKVIKKI